MYYCARFLNKHSQTSTGVFPGGFSLIWEGCCTTQVISRKCWSYSLQQEWLLCPVLWDFFLVFLPPFHFIIWGCCFHCTQSIYPLYIELCLQILFVCFIYFIVISLFELLLMHFISHIKLWSMQLVVSLK